MMMWNWHDEWSVVKSTIPEWEPFIFSNEIFWPLNFEKNSEFKSGIKPRLTAGRLLIALFFLDYFRKSDPHIDSLINDDIKKISGLKSQWKSNWRKKIQKELTFRMSQWRDLIRKIQKNKLTNAEFQNQLQIRLMIECLMEDGTEAINDDLFDQIEQMDLVLKNNSVVSQFIWDDTILSAFDSNKHWYLFRNIQGFK